MTLVELQDLLETAGPPVFYRKPKTEAPCPYIVFFAYFKRTETASGKACCKRTTGQISYFSKLPEDDVLELLDKTLNDSGLFLTWHQEYETDTGIFHNHADFEVNAHV